MINIKIIVPLAVAAILATATLATAQIVQNGSFQTGDLTDWGNNAPFSGVDTTHPGGGINSGYINTTDTSNRGYLYQGITLDPLTTYTVTASIWGYNTGTSGELEIALSGGAVIASTPFADTGIGTGVFDTYSFDFTTTSATSYFVQADEFVADPGQNGGIGGLNMTNVSIVEALAAPEPSTYALWLGGMAVFFLFGRQRAARA